MHLREKRGRLEGCVCAPTHVRILLPCDICLSNYDLALRVITQHLLNKYPVEGCFLPPSDSHLHFHWLCSVPPLHREPGGGLPDTTCVAKPAFPGDQPLCSSAQVCPEQSRHSCSSLRQKENIEAGD